MTLTPQDVSDLIAGVRMRVCIIETGSPYLRAGDAAALRPKDVRALDSSQRDLIARLEYLLARLEAEEKRP